MEIALNTQQEMIEMSGYFVSPSEYDSLTDFERYYFSRDLIKSWNLLPLEERNKKSIQIEVYGFNVNTPMWL